MTHEANWSPEEFELLMSRPDLEDVALAAIIQTRSVGAISAVRAGVCEFHRSNQDTHAMLSEMMKERLDAKPRSFPCAKCGEVI